MDIRKGQLDENGNEIILPTPDYTTYNSNYNAIPGDGLTEAELFPSKCSSAQVVRFVDENLQLPTTFKANISYHRYLTDWLRVGISGYYNKTTNLLEMVNANLRETPAFTLNGEGGREVYTPLEKMKAKGADFSAARKSDQFAQALMFTNGYESSFKAVVIDAALSLPKGGSLYAGYTRAETKGAERYRNEDNQRFVGASYFDNNNFINDGYSPNDFKHKILVNLTTPKVAGFTMGAFLNMVERGRFSALIGPADVMRNRYTRAAGICSLYI